MRARVEAPAAELGYPSLRSFAAVVDTQAPEQERREAAQWPPDALSALAVTLLDAFLHLFWVTECYPLRPVWACELREHPLIVAVVGVQDGARLLQ